MTDFIPKILRLKEVMERTGKSRSSVYADMAKGCFPCPVAIGTRAVGWLEQDISEWIMAREKVRK